MSDLLVVYTPDARKHLRDVRSYSERIWEAEQRERFMKQLFAAIELIRCIPFRGKPRDDLATGLRCCRSGRHFIFYRVDKLHIVIVAVLHERMDPKRHLG